MQHSSAGRMLIRLLVFGVLLTALVFALDLALFDESTVTPSWKAVRNGETVDVLFVGNSHTYASLDDQVLGQALNKNVQLLRCSSANGGIVASMLEAWLHYNVPELVVLECNPFMVDNYATMRGNLRGIVYQSFDGIPGYWQKAKALSKVMDMENVPAGVFQLLRPTGMWSRWQQKAATEAPGYEPYHSFTFQYDYVASELEDYYRIPENQPMDGKLLAQNQQALDRIIELSEKLDFELWLIVAPVAHYADGYQQDMRKLYAISQRCDRITLFDNAMQQLSTIGLTAQDFYDAGHLCRRGAEKYTQHMLSLLANHYGVQPQLEHVLAYKGESAQVADGMLHLQMDCYGDALYQFCYADEQGNAIQTGFGAGNTLQLPQDTAPESVLVQMKLNGGTEMVQYHFMQQEE